MDSINETIERHGNVWKVYSKKKVNSAGPSKSWANVKKLKG